MLRKGVICLIGNDVNIILASYTIYYGTYDTILTSSYNWSRTNTLKNTDQQEFD